MPDAGDVPALLVRPPTARSLLVLAHGAGAGMRHSFMDALAVELAAADVATFRYEFPYMANRRGAPDSPAVATATVAAAVHAGAEAAPDLPLFAGGKSFGGRMTSEAAATAPLPRVRGLVFVGFPLHPPKKPATKRADHLSRVTVPMLFLQGTRDDLATLDLLRPITDRLGPLATLHIVDGADHAFHVLKRSGRTDADVLIDLGATTASWVKVLCENR